MVELPVKLSAEGEEASEGFAKHIEEGDAAFA